MTPTNTNTNTNTTKEASDMSKSINIEVPDSLLDLLADKIAARLSVNVDVAVEADAPAPKSKAAKTEPEAEAEVEVEVVTREGREKTLKAMKIAELRAAAIAAGFAADDVKGADKATIIDALLDDEFSDEDSDADEPDDSDDSDEDEDDDSDSDSEDEDEDEDEDSDEDDDEDSDEDSDEDYTREDLEGMSLRELKALAKENGYGASELKGLDQDGVVDLLLGEDEDEDDEEEDEDDDDEGYTEDDLLAMPIGDLRSLAKDWGVKIKPADAKSKKKIVAALMAAE